MSDRQYIPSNGTEGYLFFRQHCARCRRDAVLGMGKDFDTCSDDELCPIVAAAFRGTAHQWREDDDGNTWCTAFEPQRAPTRCEHTPDLFK